MAFKLNLTYVNMNESDLLPVMITGHMPYTETVEPPPGDIHTQRIKFNPISRTFQAQFKIQGPNIAQRV